MRLFNIFHTKNHPDTVTTPYNTQGNSYPHQPPPHQNHNQRLLHSAAAAQQAWPSNIKNSRNNGGDELSDYSYDNDYANEPEYDMSTLVGKVDELQATVDKIDHALGAHSDLFAIFKNTTEACFKKYGGMMQTMMKATALPTSNHIGTKRQAGIHNQDHQEPNPQKKRKSTPAVSPFVSPATPPNFSSATSSVSRFETIELNGSDSSDESVYLQPSNSTQTLKQAPTSQPKRLLTKTLKQAQTSQPKRLLAKTLKQAQTSQPKRLLHSNGLVKFEPVVFEPFPLKLHRMLIEVEAAKKSDIISFVENGRAFVIHDTVQFFEDIVPQYFRVSRLSSFKRQLNVYGFERVNTGLGRVGYFHEHFIKDQPELCRNIKKKVDKSGLKGKDVSVSSTEMEEGNE